MVLVESARYDTVLVRYPVTAVTFFQISHHNCHSATEIQIQVDNQRRHIHCETPKTKMIGTNVHQCNVDIVVDTNEFVFSPLVLVAPNNGIVSSSSSIGPSSPKSKWLLKPRKSTSLTRTNHPTVPTTPPLLLPEAVQQQQCHTTTIERSFSFLGQSPCPTTQLPTLDFFNLDDGDSHSKDAAHVDFQSSRGPLVPPRLKPRMTPFQTATAFTLQQQSKYSTPRAAAA